MKKESETLRVLLQPLARNSYWANNIRDGIRDAARDWQDTILALDADALPDLDGIHVLVVGNDAAWLESSVALLMNRGALPIIINACMLPFRQFRCSGVVFELEEMLDHCLELLSASGRQRTVLLGVNPVSITDRKKCDAFGRPDDIVPANGRLDDCVTGFLDTLDETGYDSVICANDTVAVCLINHAAERGIDVPERLHVIGMGNSYVGAGLRIPLTSVMFDYREMGAMAVQLYHNLCQSSIRCHMTVSLPCRLILRKSAPLRTAPAPKPPPQSVAQPHHPYFDGDEVQNIISIEAMLQSADPVDREILFGIARGEGCDAIAERLFFSSRAVRYRLTNLVNRYGYPSRAALENALRKAILNNQSNIK